MKVQDVLQETFRVNDLDATKFLEHMLLTYFYLRLGLALISLAYPPLLWFGGAFMGGETGIQTSISAYYFTSVQPLFVGVLLVISVLLFMYKGYSRFENYALNFAGLFLIGVALIPASPPDMVDPPLITLHDVCAYLFFISIAYVCFFRSGDTLIYLSSKETAAGYKFVYQILGWAMVILPLLATALAFLNDGSNGVFWSEVAAILVFGIYWLFKSIEIKRSSFGLIAVGPA